LYLGIEKHFPEQLLYHSYLKERRQTKDSYPKKKKKQYNQSYFKRRIVVEHDTAICRLKKIQNFDGQLFYKIMHKFDRAFLLKVIRWTERINF